MNTHHTKIITSGFVSVVGRPNAGKSTLLNNLVQSPLALVSKKANATRKRMDFIVPFENETFHSQIIFIDTPGLHVSTKLLNEYMINEALKAIGDSDISLFIAVASKNPREIQHYREFLQKYKKKHILVLNKIDLLSKDELLVCLQQYKKYQSHYLSLIPLQACSPSALQKNALLLEIAKNIPQHPHFYDSSIISTTMMRDIYKEAIREAIFERFSDEIPYQSDIKILKITQKPHILYIKAQIIVEKDSQKSMIIGKDGATIKSLGILARKKCEIIHENKVFLELYVRTIRNWSKNKAGLRQSGYE